METTRCVTVYNCYAVVACPRLLTTRPVFHILLICTTVIQYITVSWRTTAMTEPLTASDRVIAWREQKRQAGLRPLTVWVHAEVKRDIEDVAFQRREDIGATLTAAFQAWQVV